MWGIISITRNGTQLAQQLHEQFPQSVVYTLPKWQLAGMEAIDGDLSSFTATLFQRHNVLVFIMATGIVVRSIAPHLKNKTVDPAVVVLDEKGKFVISLISGHLGGANDVAGIIAAKIGAQPVITTSSDINGLLAVDSFAQQNNLLIENMHDAKVVTSLLVNGGIVAQRNESGVTIPLQYSDNEAIAKGVVIVSNLTSAKANIPFVRLIPRNIVLGVGCRRGVAGSAVISFILNELKKHNIDSRSITCMATIELKKNEEGLNEAAKYFGVELITFSTYEILTIEDKFEISAFVKKQVGVGSVCEPAAYLACKGKGRFVQQKQKYEGITLAIMEIISD